MTFIGVIHEVTRDEATIWGRLVAAGHTVCWHELQDPETGVWKRASTIRVDDVPLTFPKARLKFLRCTPEHRYCCNSFQVICGARCPQVYDPFDRFWVCTRPAGHKGLHVACRTGPVGPDETLHNLAVWDNAGEIGILKNHEGHEIPVHA